MPPPKSSKNAFALLDLEKEFPPASPPSPSQPIRTISQKNARRLARREQQQSNPRPTTPPPTKTARDESSSPRSKKKEMFPNRYGWTWDDYKTDWEKYPPHLQEYCYTVCESIHDLRSISQNQRCADCKYTNGPSSIRANTSLGLFLCTQCAKAHEENLPAHMSRILSTVKDFLEWRPEDLQMMAIGNLRNAKYWGGIISLADAQDGREKKSNEFVFEKYVQGKFIKGDKEVDPWSLSPLQKEEIEVLNLELERPDDSDEWRM